MINNLGRSAQLVQILTQSITNPACQRFQPQLEAYIAAQLNGQPYTTLFPEVALHLDACVACAEVYDLLYELAQAEATNSVLVPSHLPAPDLSFLAPLALPSLLEQVRLGLQRIGETIRLQLTPLLLPKLHPTPAMAAMRGLTDDQRYQEVLLRLEPLPALAEQWPVGLTVYRDTQQPAFCLVEVLVEPPDRNWPELAGIRVSLVNKDEKNMATTDAWGLATFEGVPVVWLSTMNIDVTL